MRNAFTKDVLRTLWHSRGRFILVAAICMLGVTMFVGIRAACENLRLSADQFFDEQQLYDVSVQSTLGLTQDDVDALAQIPDVLAAEGSWTETAYTTVDGVNAAVSVRVWSDGGMNEPYLEEGRLPQSGNEVAVTPEFLDDTGLSIGDHITFSADTSSSESDDASEDDSSDANTDDTSFDEDISVDSEQTSEQFIQQEYTIVGVVLDPLSVNAKQGTSSFRATGPKYSFFVTPEAVDPSVADVYSIVYLQVEGASELLGFSQAYEDKVAAVTKEAEEIKTEREEARTLAIKTDAQSQVDEAERELYEQLEDAQDQIDDAQEQINDALAQIEEGREELRVQRENLVAAQQELDGGAKQLESARSDLDDLSAQLDSAASQLPGGQAELDAAREALASAQKQAEDGLAALPSAREQLAQAREKYEQQAAAWPAQREELAGKLSALQEPISNSEQEIDALEEEIARLETIENPTDEQLEQLEAAKNQLTATKKTLETLRSQQSELQDAIDQGDQSLKDAASYFTSQEEALDATETQLTAALKEMQTREARLNDWQHGLEWVAVGRKGVAQGRAQISTKQATLEAAQAEIDAAWPLIEDGEAELDEGTQEAAEGQAELDDQVAEFEQSKREALEKIEEARKEIDDIEKATWYVQDRGAISSYASIDSDASSIEVIGTVFPAIFLTVAILVSLTTASRMVEEDRVLIGLYKALGYSRRVVMSKYIIYMLGASLVGGAVGAVLGFVALPSFLSTVFAVMYTLPTFSLFFDVPLCILAIGMFAVALPVATVITCRSELAEQPASLMRPKAPKAGSHILLERIRPLWKCLSFLNKVTARNLLRYKRRFAMTVFGVAGCTALMIVGFAISDSVNALSPNQYGDASRLGVYDYDLMAVANQADDLPELAEQFTEDTEVSNYIPVITDSLTLEYEGRKETVQLMVIPDGFELDDYIELKDMNGNSVDIVQATLGPDGIAGTDDDGVLVTNNASDVLNFSVGNEVQMQDSALREATARVDGVVVNYLGNVVYMTQPTYEQLFGVTGESNALLAHLSGDSAEQIAFTDELEHNSLVRQVTGVERSVRDFESNFMLINYVVVLLVILAAGLSFVVLFTLATTNISERERELATIKVLGFRRKEVHTYVNKETIVLTLIGTLAGIPLGAFLSHMLTYVLVMPSMYFAVEIHPVSFVISCAFSLLFAFVVNLICNKSLDRVDMVSALKSPE
ncbi:FtsX-like permease family protein [Olsenella sp. Marseille-QA0557]|uniref:FtsX-like permease family protein n=1 Tax=Olsenella sp. Marseille-QA0557 TaxID=3378782 RepID=UPI003D0AE38C